MSNSIRTHTGLIVGLIAPVLWGLSWIGTSELLPHDAPVYSAAMRALPTGLVLMLFVRALPKGEWWWKVLVLATLNFGLFFVMLTIAAYRVPGGIGATMGALQPLFVMLIGIPLLGIMPRVRPMLITLIGTAGVALLVLNPSEQLDTLGVLAAIGAVVSMSFGVTLMQRWYDPNVSSLGLAAWQLTAAGVMMLVASLFVEGAPPAVTGDLVLGVLFVGVISTGIGNWLWFIALSRIPAAQASFFMLITPLVATAAGWIVLNETLTPLQALGGVVALASVVVSQMPGRSSRARVIDPESAEDAGVAPAAPAVAGAPVARQ